MFSLFFLGGIALVLRVGCSGMSVVGWVAVARCEADVEGCWGDSTGSGTVDDGLRAKRS